MSTIVLATNDFYIMSKLIIQACVPPHYRRKHKKSLKLLIDALNTGNKIIGTELADVITDVRHIAKGSDIKDALNFALEIGEKEKSEGDYLKFCECLKKVHQLHDWFSRSTHIMGTNYVNNYIIISFNDSPQKVSYWLDDAEQKVLMMSPPS